jgi:hypothetical protein
MKSIIIDSTGVPFKMSEEAAYDVRIMTQFNDVVSRIYGINGTFAIEAD